MIGVAYGTTGELIKLSPILVRLNETKEPAFTLCTGQQVQQIPALLRDFNLPQPDLLLARGKDGHDLTRPADLPSWFLKVVIAFTRQRKTLRARLTSGAKPLLVVHGDTFTTVLGSLMGHALQTPVAHVEAGMRSGDWHNPFPEELNRLMVARLAQVHFAPGRQAAANLHKLKVRGEIVDTGYNTISDALELVKPETIEVELPSEPFGLVSLHRFELLGKPASFQAILELLREASRSKPILLIDHPVTAAAIAAHDLGSLFDGRFLRVPRQRYFHFIALLKASAFLVTDSGGSQQECAQMGHPCLVHRAVTEHDDGLDGPVVLSRLNLDVARDFLHDPPVRVKAPTDDQISPTDVILNHLESRGHLNRTGSAPPRSNPYLPNYRRQPSQAAESI